MKIFSYYTDHKINSTTGTPTTHTTVFLTIGKGGAPPPPPPGGLPPPPPLPEADFANLSLDDRSALFAEINRGEAITNSMFTFRILLTY